MAGTTRVDLVSNVGAGNGVAMPIQAGKYAFMAEATFGGGSVALQIQDPQGTWLPVTGSTFAANGMVILELPAGLVRAVVVTATAAYAWLITVPTITTR